MDVDDVESGVVCWERDLNINAGRSSLELRVPVARRGKLPVLYTRPFQAGRDNKQYISTVM